MFTVAPHVDDKITNSNRAQGLISLSLFCVFFIAPNSGGISLSRIGCPFSGYVATTFARVALFLMLAPPFAKQKRFVVFTE